MPTVLKDGDVVMAQAWCVANEQASVNSFFYFVTAVGIANCTDQDFADDIDALIGPPYSAILTTANEYRGIYCRIVQRFPPAAEPAPVAAVTNANPGLVAGTTLPRQASGILSWQTALAGRKYRGRTYLPFPPSSFDALDGVPSGAALTAYAAIGNPLLAYTTNVASGCSFKMVLYGRPKPSAVPPIPYTVTDMVGVITPSKWATQRRRGSYGRPNTSPI